MKENVQHIDIPLDELGVFKQVHQDRYQQILMQTLLLSTLATVHNSDKNYKASVYVTLKSVWLVKKEKIKAIIPTRSVLSVVKSYKHPELVIIMRENVDNLRLTASSEARCWYIISALSYVFTYAFNNPLPYYNIKQTNLDYFERTVQDKSKSHSINLDSYPVQMVNYIKPFLDKQDIFGHLKPKSKIILQKQLQMQSSDVSQNHLIYLARIKCESVSDSNSNSFLPDNFEQQDRYICHYVAKQKSRMQAIYQHKNMPIIQQLIYAKSSQFKIQLFFQFGLPLRGHTVTPVLFHKLWQLYSQAKSINTSHVLTTDSILVVQRSGLLGERVRRVIEDDGSILGYNVGMSGQEKYIESKWETGEWKLVVKEFRYGFLNQAVQWDKFMYQKQEYQVNNNRVQDQKEQNKEQIDKQSQKQQKSKTKSSSSSTQSKQKQQLDICSSSIQHVNSDLIIRQVRQQTRSHICQQFLKKVYNIGLILYELVTGRHLFSYIPAFISEYQMLEQQIQLIFHFKSIIASQRYKRTIQIFPKFLDFGTSQILKNFIECCIFGVFDSYQHMCKHPWLAKNDKKQMPKKENKQF